MIYHFLQANGVDCDQLDTSAPLGIHNLISASAFCWELKAGWDFQEDILNPRSVSSFRYSVF